MIRLFFVLFGTFLIGCTYVPPSKNKADWFATVEESGPGKLTPVPTVAGFIYLEISSTSWEPLLGPDGFGGKRTGYEYWAILPKDQTIFRDPDLAENGMLVRSHHRGTITIDKKEKKVIIDLQRITSKPGEPESLEPSPANGTYPLRRWTK